MLRPLTATPPSRSVKFNTLSFVREFTKVVGAVVSTSHAALEGVVKDVLPAASVCRTCTMPRA